MNLTFTPKYVNLRKVVAISRGNNDKLKRYLLQFITLVPERIEMVDRKLILMNGEVLKLGNNYKHLVKSAMELRFD